MCGVMNPNDFNERSQNAISEEFFQEALREIFAPKSTNSCVRPISASINITPGGGKGHIFFTAGGMQIA